MTIVGHLAGGFLVAKTLAGRIRRPELSHDTLLLLGTLGGALPDLDYFIYVAQTGSWVFGSDYQHHKWITHTFPFYSVPGILLYLYGLVSHRNKLCHGALVVTAGACIHLLQDMVGTVDGIMWAWPFSQRMDGICLVGTHGQEWIAAYTRHPIAWIERIIVIVASLVFACDVWAWIRHRNQSA